MNLYVRLLLAWLKSTFEARKTTQLVCSQQFRVWPHDIDLFGHMNNGRYLQIMDVARFRWLLTTGTIAAIRRRQWTVALGGSISRFRRPLSLLQRYHVRSQLLCWDERWFYLEHVFTSRSGKFIASGMSRAAFRGGGRWITTQEVMDEVDPGATSIPIPDHVLEWVEAEHKLGQYCDPARSTPCNAEEDAVVASFDARRLSRLAFRRSRRKGGAG